MEFDRQMYSQKVANFSQLFIARSPRLCRFVENAIGAKESSKFTTFRDLVDNLEDILPKGDDYTELTNDKYVDYFRFKHDFFKESSEGIDALIAWTNIRSFIKGSIEAFCGSNHAVSEEDYISSEMFGKKRCRFTIEQRKEIYKIYLRYQEYLQSYNLWDDCDRIAALITRLQNARISNPDLFVENTWLTWSKLYVDEVQDYTQSECLLFFLISGPENLFLAGDPAQNVARGVEFRFEDIRSVGYYVAGNNEDKKNLIPQKPKVVNINFRSHAGILECGR